MPAKSNVELMAACNQWMNKSIYRAASKISTDELSKDRGAFFGSLLETLNHIMVGDILWLQRFADHPSRLNALNYVRGIKTPPSLNSILYANFKNPAKARIKLDRVISGFDDELTDETLLSTLSYKNTKDVPFTKNMGHLVQHFLITKRIVAVRFLPF